MKRITIIAFTCFPMAGLSQTPSEVWICDRSLASLSIAELESEERLVQPFDAGQVYVRPETLEYFTGEGDHVELPNTWANFCSDNDGIYQTVLTDYGCNLVQLTNELVNSTIVSLDLFNKEIRVTTTALSDKSQSIAAINYTNCKVVSPMLFE